MRVKNTSIVLKDRRSILLGFFVVAFVSIILKAFAVAAIPPQLQDQAQRMPAVRDCSKPHIRCTWELTFGGKLQDKAYGITSMPDNGLVVAGNTRSFGGFGYDAWILRLDRAGNAQWEKRYGGKDNDQVYAVTATKEGGVVIAGHTRSKGAGNSDVWLLNLDADGALIWERTFGGLGEDRARTVIATNDGGFVAAGFTRSVRAAESDAWIIKIDGSGQHVWDRTLENFGDNGIFSITGMPDDGLMAAGYIDTGGRTSRYTNPNVIIEIPFDPVLYLKIITERRADISFDNYFEKVSLYQNMLKSGKVKSLGEIARKEKVSKARISQIMALRNLAPEIKDWLLTIADNEQVDLSLTRVNEIRTGVKKKKITEKKLRQIATIRNHKQQIQKFREFLKSFTAIIEPNQD